MSDGHGEGLCTPGAERLPNSVQEGQGAPADARSRHHAAVAQLGLRALGGADLQGLMDEAVSMLTRVLDVEYAKVLELLPDGHELLLRAGTGWAPGCRGFARVPAGGASQAGYTLLSDAPVVVEDLRTETRFTAAQLLTDHRVISGLSVLIAGREGPFGVLGAHTRHRRRFTSDEVQFVQSVANVLGMAIERQRIETELRLSDARMRAIVEAAPDGIISLDDAGRIIDLNPAAEMILRHRWVDVVGTPARDLLAPHPSAQNPDSLAQWLDGMTSRGALEIAARRADGTAFPAEINVTQTGAGAGGHTLFLRDLTERQQLERERAEHIREQQAEAARLQLAAIVESSEDAIIGKTLDGVVTSWNAAAERLYGYTAAEMIGQPIARIVPPDRLQELNALNAGLQRGVPVASHETVRVRKDGRCVDIALTLSLIRDPGGRPVAAAAIAHDISQRKQAEAAIRRQAALLNLAPVAILVVDMDRRITYWNQAAERTYGHTAEEVIGRVSHEVLATRFPIAQEEIRAIVARESLWEGELVQRCADGREIVVLSRWSAETDTQGRQVGFLQIDRDITERKLLELQLLEANRLKSEFLANMSHELRTPLNAIIGFADLMYRGKTGPLSPEHHEYLGDILTSGRHLLRLINDILDLARIEAGKMAIRPEAVDMVQLTAEVRDVVRALAASKRLDIQVDVDEDARRVSADPARIKQILYNFLSNALKFTPEGGHVAVRIAPEGPSLFRIDVEDTGIGIHPEHLGKLFVEFQQIDAGAAKRHQGTGLGLALTRRIAEAHGGRVAVRSTPGAGSTFSAILPRTTPPSAPPS